MHRVSRLLRRSVTLGLTVLVLGIGATGYGAEDKASRFYEDALARYEKKDIAGAIIQLRNALKEDPKNLSANLLLGQAHLANSQPVEALDAFEKASKYGADRSEVAVPMAHALLGTGKSREVLTRFPVEGMTGSKRMEMLVIRGQAYRQEGELVSAESSFEEARGIDPNAINATLALADLMSVRGRRTEALALADDAIRVKPQDPSAWYVKGSILQRFGDVAGAIRAYDQALTFDPRMVDARVSRATLLLNLGRIDAVAVDVDYLKREFPNEPRANYLRAVYLSGKGDAAGTQAALMEITQALDPVPIDILQARLPELLMLGGLAHHGLGAPQKARGYLNRFLQVHPGHPGASKVMGSMYLEQRDYVNALSVLEPLLKTAPNDPQALALLASANLGRGRGQQAARYLERALELGGESPEIQATLGLSLLRTGQSDVGMKHLEAAFAKDPNQDKAGAALALLYIRRGDPKRAVAIAEQMAQRFPSNLSVLNLVGVARAAAGDMRGARSAYEQAIRTDPSFTAAQLNLAKLDVQEKKLGAAKERLLAVEKARPKDIQAMFELGRLEDSAGNPAEAARWFEKARAIDQRDLKVALALTDLYLRTKEPAKALDIVRIIEPFEAENLEVLAALSSALLANGDSKGSINVLTRMTKIAEFDAVWQTRIAQLQMRANNMQGAGYSLDKAIAGNPAYLPARVTQVEVDLLSGQIDRAEARATAILREKPDLAIGYRLSADVAMRRGKYADAVNGYRAALAKEPSTEHALRVYEAHVRSGSVDKGIAFLEGWAKDHRGDFAVTMALAEGYLRAGNLAEARARYEALLKERGEEPNLLNNLANVAAKQGDGAKAVEYAERAFKAAPQDGLIQDTLGWLLVQNGAVDTGLKNLREARLRAPGNPEVRYHLAVALARSGRKDEARKELNEVIAANTRFDGIDDARQLQRELSKTP